MSLHGLATVILPIRPSPARLTMQVRTELRVSRQICSKKGDACPVLGLLAVPVPRRPRVSTSQIACVIMICHEQRPSRWGKNRVR